MVNLTLAKLSLSSLSHSPMVSANMRSLQSSYSFSKLSLNKFSNSFYISHRNNEYSSFTNSKFRNFLKSPIQIDAQLDFVNKVYTSTISSDDCQGSFNVFHCSFQNCKETSSHGGAAICLANINHATVRIGYNSFMNCVCSTSSTDGGAIFIGFGSGKAEFLSDCFYKCSAESNSNALVLKNVDDETMAQMISVDDCNNEKPTHLGYTVEMSSKSISFNSLNISHCSAVFCPTIRAIFKQNSELKFIHLSHNQLLKPHHLSCFFSDELPKPITAKLDYWNIINTIKPAEGTLIQFWNCDAIAFHGCIRNTSSKVSFAREGLYNIIQVYDFSSDREFYRSLGIQWGEGCVAVAEPTNVKMPNLFEKACYHTKEVKNIFSIDWYSIITGVCVVIGFFAVAYLCILIARKYVESVNTKIDQEVVGDMTALVRNS